ncbi:DUF3857 domain-containing protein [Solitalea lacus]|uniref:DUF3857 domain-containing protein n=1 Tax=Solitalea lacus TaxID=2911172 RepID=UPI001EDAC014|nr:tetratricopeptide repeat protein [Solitalea lacus]UKJ08972.1 tetratricopeptide repeat protein [Solitalea lacus]
MLFLKDRRLSALITILWFSSINLTFAQSASLTKAWTLFYENKRTEAYALFNEASVDPTSAAEAYLGLAMLASIDKPQSVAFANFVKFYDKHPNPAPFLYASWSTELVNSGLNRKTEAELAFFKKIAASTNIDGSVVALSNAAIAKHLVQTKQPGEKEVSDRIGSIDSWKLVGEFENISTSGFDKVYEPVTVVSEDKTFINKNGASVKWFDIPAIRRDRWIDMTYYFWDNHNSVTYAQNFVNSPADQEVYLRSGVSGSLKIWINDSPVVSESEERNNDIDSYITKVKLNKGYNRLLVQVGESYADRLNFLLRFTDENGTPIKGLSYLKNVQPYQKETVFKAQIVSLFAEKYFKDQIKNHPDYLVNHLMLANLYLRNDRTFEAQKILTDVQKKVPNCSYVTSQLIELYSKSDNRTWLTAEQEHLKEQDPENPISINLFYSEAYGKEDYKECERLLTKLKIIFGDNDPNVIAKNMELLAANKRMEELVATAENAYKLYPNNYDFVAAKFAVEKNIKNNNKSAEAVLLTFIKNNDHYTALKTLADFYIDQGSAEKAIQLYEQDAKADPIGVDLYNKQARIYYKNQNYAKTEEMIKKALAVSPQSSDSWSDLGLVYRQLGQNQKAVDAYKKAISFNSANFSAIHDLRKLEDKKDVFSYFVDTDNYDMIRKAGAAAKYPDDNSIIVNMEKQKVVYPGGASEEKNIVVAKILTNEGLEYWKKVSIAVYGDQNSTLEKAEVIKANGTKVQAESDESTIVFTNLEVGDAIQFIYKVENHNPGKLRGYFWDKFYFSRSFPSLRLKYSLLVANDIKFQHQVVNGKVAPNVTPKDEFTLYEWEISEQPAIRYEDKMPVLADVGTMLFVSSIPDWDFVSKWYNDLASYKAKADYEVKEVVNDLFKDKRNLTDQQKVKIIYNYIIKNITYSSVSFRQSGLIPQRPATVINTRIGDCKDVSTLFVTLCKEVGVAANLVLVNTRDNGLNGLVLPSIDFNHCIAKASFGGKEYYFELTSNFLPFGANYSNSVNSQILDITQPGKTAALSNLNPATRLLNVINRKTNVLLVDNSLNIQENTCQTGGPGAYIKSYYGEKSEQEQKKLITQAISHSYPNVLVNSVKFQGLETGADTTKCSLSYSLNDVMNEVGGMSIFTLPWSSKTAAKDFVFTQDRKYPIDVSEVFYADIDTETITLTIPDKKTIVDVPASVSLTGSVGEYSMSYKLAGNKLVCTRMFKLKQQVIPLADIATFNEFYRKVIASDNKQLAIKIKPGA